MSLTIENATDTFEGNGFTTAFPTQIVAFDASQIEVYLREDGVDVEQTPVTDYTVSGLKPAASFAENDYGVTVNFTVPPAVGKTIIVSRTTLKQQLLKLTSTRAYNPEVIMTQLDRIVMMIQEIHSRSLRSLFTATPTSRFAPVGPNTTVAWDGSTFVSGPTLDQLDAALDLIARIGTVASATVYSFTAEAEQVAFTGADDSGKTLSIVGVPMIFLNGACLAPADYEFDGTTLTLNVPAAENDLVMLIDLITQGPQNFTNIPALFSYSNQLPNPIVPGKEYRAEGYSFRGRETPGSVYLAAPYLTPGRDFAYLGSFGVIGDGLLGSDADRVNNALASYPYLKGEPGQIVACEETIIIPSNRLLDFNGLDLRRGFNNGFCIRSEKSRSTWDDVNIHIKNLSITDDGTSASRGGGLNLAGERMSLTGYRNTCTAAFDGIAGSNAIYVTGKDIMFRDIFIDNTNMGLWADGIHAGYLENFVMTNFLIKCSDDALALHPERVEFDHAGPDLLSRNVVIQGGFLRSVLSNGIRLGTWGSASGALTPKVNVGWHNVLIDAVIGKCGTSVIEMVDNRTGLEIALGLKNTDITIRVQVEEQTDNVRLINIAGNSDIDNVANLGKRNYGKIDITINGEQADVSAFNGHIRAGGFDHLTLRGTVFGSPVTTATENVFSGGGTVIFDGYTNYPGANGSAFSYKWIENVEMRGAHFGKTGLVEFQTHVFTLTAEVAMSLRAFGGVIEDTARPLNISGTGRIKDWIVEGVRLDGSVGFNVASLFASVTWEPDGIFAHNPVGGYRTTVGQLPGASIPVPTGARATVTDATATTFAANPTGGGILVVPVYRDGIAWRIG